MGGENGKWLGIASAIMVRLGATALRGEARYINGSSGRPNRSTVYTRVLNRSLSRHRGSVAPLTNILMFGEFHSGAVGGPNWARCGKALARLCTAIGNLASHPGDAEVGELLRALNGAINQAHNGGWWMNKFAAIETFDAIQKGGVYSVLGACPAIMLVKPILEDISGRTDYLEGKISEWSKWPETIISPVPIKSVAVSINPGVGLGLTLTSRLVRNHRVIRVPLSSRFLVNRPEIIRDIAVFPVEGGIHVVQETKGKPSVLLLEETIDSYEKKGAVK